MTTPRRKKRRASVRIQGQQAGMTVMDFLVHRFTYHDAIQWRRQIVSGRIRVNRRSTNSDQRLATDDILDYWPPARPEPPVDRNFSILFEDEDILAVNKPGNLPCHPAGRYFTQTLWHILRDTKGLKYMSLINRLDRETSGIVLIAKHGAAAKGCRCQFETGTVRKRYRVLVEGRFPDKPIHAEGRITSASKSQIRKKFEFLPAAPVSSKESAGKFCETILKKETSFADISLLSVTLKTGRTHQIRATLEALGYPVVADKMYGVDETIYLRFISDRLTADDHRRLRMIRQALHAAELELKHPKKDTPLVIHAPMPGDMLGMIDSVKSAAIPTAQVVK